MPSESAFDLTTFLQNLTSLPGVYCMYDKASHVLYVGKAKNLKHRVSSYFRQEQIPRIAKMVQKIARIEVTITNSENEALLLENSLIKSLNPRYNIVFRDDKSYPYLLLSKHVYPRLLYFRGKSTHGGTFYGPYPSTQAVRSTLTILQKLFKLRSCDDIFFKNRSRPCLQYQIKRCTAPCCGYISENDYAQDVQHAALFLEGKENAIIQDLMSQMQASAEKLDYEKAGELRDQIQALTHVHEEQVVHKHHGNADVIAVDTLHGDVCIQLLYIRQGRILDSQSFYPKQSHDACLEDVLRAFINQFYLDRQNKRDYPNDILLSQAIDDQQLIAQTLSDVIGHRIHIRVPQRGDGLKWVKLASLNASQALRNRANQSTISQKRWFALKNELGIANGFNRIECFDISHTQGEGTVASTVVFDVNGPCKREYRTYTLDVGNNDYEAMEQVVLRRYTKRKASEAVLPEVILIDGGVGQLQRARKALLELQMLDVILIGIAKGEGRRTGLETLFVSRMQDETLFQLNLLPTSMAFHLLTHIRDESHRFAIKRHRQKRAKTRKQSSLESIPGLGKKRVQQLLIYFGGLKGIMGASEASLAKVPGIGPQLAHVIYTSLHEA